MFSISKDFEFSASHMLEDLPLGHKCARLHGHNYKVRVSISTDKLDRIGFVVDYADLDSFKKFLDEHVDHAHLNNVVTFNPTAENLARWLRNHLVDMVRLDQSDIRVFQIAVGVSETGKTWAWYS